MKRTAIAGIGIAVLGAIAACAAPGAGQAGGAAAPLFGVVIPPGYRDWRLISVGREEGHNDDLRAVLGNDVAIAACRERRIPFPDGTIIARLAWGYTPLAESAEAFGAPQSHVAGPSPVGPPRHQGEGPFDPCGYDGDARSGRQQAEAVLKRLQGPVQ